VEPWPHALDLALAQAGAGDLICCTGSVFVAAEARAAWFARQGLPVPASESGLDYKLTFGHVVL